ncbi:MAG: hypothetical protein LH474_00505 [Chamaesiphon sp.]|nr:hypothetical protein [Chamaesiphon sp.]
MNHNLSDDSANVHPSGQAVVDRESHELNPAIGQALGCLDIKLEDELTRFRSNHTDRLPERQLSPVVTEAWENSEDLYADRDIFTAQIIQPAVAGTVVAANEDDRPEPSGFIIIDGLTTSATTSEDLSTSVSYAPMTIYREDSSSQQESLNVNFATSGEIAPFHDEYLSSSQELLRQIQSGYPTSTETFNRTQTATPKPKNKYFTPLKIGSMAAACVLAGGAVYTALNPNILTTLTATKLAVPTTSNLIQTPNLAANEFTELNLSTINNIKLPTTVAAAPTTNVSIATSNLGTTATVPAPVPFTRTQVVPTATMTSQPRLADSLIKSLLPPNFQAYAKSSGYRSIPSGIKR